MGDRTWWKEKCPQCNQEIEVCDAPSSLQFVRACEECKWTDGLSYYEIDENTIELLTKEEAEKRGFIS